MTKQREVKVHNVCAQPADDVKASSQEDLTSDNAESVLKVKYEVEITLGGKKQNLNVSGKIKG